MTTPQHQPRKMLVPLQFLQRKPSMPKFAQWFLEQLTIRYPDYLEKQTSNVWEMVLQFKSAYTDKPQRDLLVLLATDATIQESVRARALFLLLLPSYFLRCDPISKKMGCWVVGDNTRNDKSQWNFLKSIESPLRLFSIFLLEQFTLVCEALFLHASLWHEDVLLRHCAHRIEMFIELYGNIHPAEIGCLYRAYPMWVYEDAFSFSECLRYHPRLQSVSVKKSQAIIRESVMQSMETENDSNNLLMQYFRVFISDAISYIKSNSLSPAQQKSLIRHIDFVFAQLTPVIIFLFSDGIVTAQWVEKVWREILTDADVLTRETLAKVLTQCIDESDVVSSGFLKILFNKYGNYSWWSVAWHDQQIERLAHNKKYQELLTKQNDLRKQKEIDRHVCCERDLQILLQYLKK